MLITLTDINGRPCLADSNRIITAVLESESGTTRIDLAPDNWLRVREAPAEILAAIARAKE